MAADRFLGQNEETWGGALTSLHKIKICLRYLGDPGYQMLQELGVSQATISLNTEFHGYLFL